MHNKFLLFITFLIVLTGCSISFEKPSIDIEPVKNISQLHDICIYQDVSSLTSYDMAQKLITDKLTALNISYKLTDSDSLNNCPYTLSYDVRRAVDIPTYLSHMDIQINDSEGSSIGWIQYFYIPEGNLITISSSSFTKTDIEINNLLDKLFNL